MTRRRQIVFGPPGTGKTTYLLAEMQKCLAAGIPAQRIAFLSFTRRAIREAKDKAAEITTEPLPYFRTIHSLAYLMLGLGRGDVVTGQHYQEFGGLVGVPFKASSPDQVLWEGGLGDRCLAVSALAKARGTSLDHEWRANPGVDLPWRLVRQTVEMWEHYKRAHGLLDFDDMIQRAEGILDVDVLFVDEAQDTSAAQWAFLRRVAAAVPVVYLAGDDDQAVYEWSGADATQLLRFRGERAVLPVSYRLPVAVKQLADRIAGRIVRRVAKDFRPRDEPGRVSWVNEPEAVDLHGTGSWLLLARSNYQLSQLRQQARAQGVVYTLPNGQWSWSLSSVRAAYAWERLRKGKDITRADGRLLNSLLAQRVTMPRRESLVWADVFPSDVGRDRPWMDALPNMPVRDREYVRTLRRSGESLTEPGRVRIGTVHSVKGAQADHVVLLTDISDRIERGALANPDAERRVQYVAVTRAKHDLTLVLPQSSTFWNF